MNEESLTGKARQLALEGKDRVVELCPKGDPVAPMLPDHRPACTVDNLSSNGPCTGIADAHLSFIAVVPGAAVIPA